MIKYSSALLLLGLSLACTSPEAAKPPTPAVKAPTARVDLPPLIKLEGTIPPETHSDHSMRVDGLLARHEKYMNQKILVRGFLVEKYVRPKKAKRFQRPHAWLSDSPAGGEKRLMLVNLSEEIIEALQVGKQYVVTGKFARRSSDGFVMSSGLLVYEGIEGLELESEKEQKKKKRGRRGRR